MNELTGQPGELRFTVSITRKATGQVDSYEMVGRVLPDEPKPIGRVHGAVGAMTGPGSTLTIPQE